MSTVFTKVTFAIYPQQTRTPEELGVGIANCIKSAAYPYMSRTKEEPRTENCLALYYVYVTSSVLRKRADIHPIAVEIYRDVVVLRHLQFTAKVDEWTRGRIKYFVSNNAFPYVLEEYQ